MSVLQKDTQKKNQVGLSCSQSVDFEDNEPICEPVWTIFSLCYATITFTC